MTNSFSGKVLYFDTPGVDASVTGRREIVAILWTSTDANTISQTDKFSITDKNGMTIAAKRAAANGDELCIPFARSFPVDAISLTSLTGGALMIYTE